MMEDKCPFCGAEVSGSVNYQDGPAYWFECETYKSPTNTFRKPQCYERQLAAQAELLKRALEVVEVVANGELYLTRDSNGEIKFTSLRIKDDDLLILPDVEALLPDLRRAVEGKT